MTDSMMYSEDAYVFLTPDASETFMTPPEMIEKLTEIVETYESELSPDLQKLADAQARAKYLLETHCEFETAPGESVQWYAVRLEK
ncbi:MAG: chlororespiratory reduction protein 7 [Cyanobacteria bacterium P01_D01_bin.105]